MRRSVFLGFIIALIAGGCSTHFSTLKPEGSLSQTIYTITEDQAFHIAHAALVTKLPGRKIEVIDGPVRGYSTYFRFVLDTYTQQVLVFAAQGLDPSSKVVRGYYFEVSGSGSAIVQGRAKNVELFERVTEAAKATGKGTLVAGVERVAYTNTNWRLNQSSTPTGVNPPRSNTREDVLNSIERLKGLRDRDVITEQEFETKKKELLERL